MKKIALGAVLVLLVTFGLVVYFFLSNLDGIVKAAIEKYGSEATQTVVSVNNVELGLKDGSGAVRGLTVGNPQGFAAKQAFSLGEVSTQIDLKSLSEDVIVIEHITVRAPEVFFELNGAGKNNLQELKQNLASGKSGKSGGKASTEKSSGAEPKLIIRKILFADGNIHASVLPLDKDYELKLPNIELNNLGGKNGATPTQIADQVLKVLTDRALAEVKKKGIDQYKAQLEGEVNERLDAEKEKINEKVGDKLKGVLGY
jgi:hypothetical protein